MAPRVFILISLIFFSFFNLQAEEKTDVTADLPVFDLSTPRKAMYSFIVAGRDGDYKRAGSILESDRPVEDKAVLARHFKFVLDQTLWITFEKISNEETGNTEDGKKTDRIGSIPYEGREIPVLLKRTVESGDTKWLVASETVQKIPELYREYGAGILAEYLPPVFFQVRFLEMEAWQWAGLLSTIIISFIGAFILARIFFSIGGRMVQRSEVDWDDKILDLLKGPFRYLLALAVITIVLEFLRLSVPAKEAIWYVLKSAYIVVIFWALLRGIQFLADVLEASLVEDNADEMRRRGVKTQVFVLRRVGKIIIIIIGAALVLSQFEVVKKIGFSLLASAGVAGLVIGLAAQQSISSILAGIQLAITQPIRIGDTVIVQNEFGWVEEINLTYIVIKVWDLRRIVVPIREFLDAPFQNWTKVSPDLLGTVILYADPTVPVENLRSHLKGLVEKNEQWDKVAWGLQVTDATEKTITLRCLVSAADADTLWNLRCEIREQMITYLQNLENGRYLPKLRIDNAGQIR